MTKLVPFADDAASVSFGKMTVENGTDRVALYGSCDLTRDKQGLSQARALKALLDQVVQVLEGAHDLPDALAPVAPAKTVRNPFA